MVFITDDDHMVSGEAFFLYDTVYLQNERTGDIYIENTFFFQFIVDWFSYTMERITTIPLRSFSDGASISFSLITCTPFDARSSTTSSL